MYVIFEVVLTASNDRQVCLSGNLPLLLIVITVLLFLSYMMS